MSIYRWTSCVNKNFIIMDFPIALETKAFVQGKTELEQIMYVCLSQRYSTILQDHRKGTNVDVHYKDVGIILMEVKATLKQISGVVVESVEFNNDVIQVLYHYNGNIEKYNYYID